MGPRLFRRGNFFIAEHFGVYYRLQWGHVFSDVEIPSLILPSATFSRASMGPRLFRRGNPRGPGASKLDKYASMGPRLFRRGNEVVNEDAIALVELQWGHVFSDVEIISDPNQST